MRLPRGRRHVEELSKIVQRGTDYAAILFVVQRPDADAVSPNWHTDPEFGTALAAAQRHGVDLYAYTCVLSASSIRIDRQIPVVLEAQSL